MAASCDMGRIVSCICFIGSICTFILGMIFLFLKIENLRLEVTDCGLFEEDCNQPWRTVFTLRPEILLDLWTPVIVGVLGAGIHVRSMKVGFVKTYVQYAIFMLITALFANFGYLGQCGVFLGAFNVLAAVLCILARLMSENAIKVLM